MTGASIQDVSVDLPTWGEAWRVLTMNAGHNTAVVMRGVAMLGLASGVVGVFALLRKRALMSDAISHATLPGITLAFLVAYHLGADPRNTPLLLVGATATGVLAAVAVHAIIRATRLTSDTAIGVVLSCSFGLGVVLLTHVQTLPTAGQGGLDHMLLGQTAAMRAGDANLLALIAALAIVPVALLFKELRLVAFDERFAAALGWRVGLLDLLVMALVTLVLVVGIQAVGIVLVVSLLIIPAASARLWTDRLRTMTVLAGVVGALGGYLGAGASALFPRLPAGGVIVLTCGGFFVVSVLIAPRNGVVASGLRLARMRYRIARDHVIRACYEEIERAGQTVKQGTGVPIETLKARRTRTPGALLGAMRLTRLLSLDDDRVVLTEKGAALAHRVTRAHRLLEGYLVRFAGVAESHVHWSADLAEHTVSDELLRELEDSLREQGFDPDDPPSVHAIVGGGS